MNRTQQHEEPALSEAKGERTKVEGRIWRTRIACRMIPLLALVAHLTPIAGAQQAKGEETGTLYGRILNPATNTTPTGVAVMLEWQESGKPQKRETVTNAEGKYEFTGLPLADEIQYTLSATVDGKTIRREGVALSTWTPRVMADLTVVKSASDASKVHVGRLTTILPSSPSPEMPQVIEFVEIHNDSAASFVQTDAKGREVGFRFSLPSTAHGIEAQGENLSTAVEGTEVLLTQPLQPGTTMLSISYMARADRRLELSRPLAFPVEESFVMLGSPLWQLKTKGYKRGETRDVHGTKYATFTRENLPASAPMEIVFKKAGKAASPTVLIVIGVLVVVAVVAIVIGIAQARRERKPAVPMTAETGTPEPEEEVATAFVSEEILLKDLSRAQLESVRQVYLDLIARLDDHHAAGTLPDILYQRLRDEQKIRLGQVLAQLETR